MFYLKKTAIPSAVYIQVHFRQDFFHRSKHCEPLSDCFKREQSDLGYFCLQYRLLKNISRQDEQMTNVLTDMKMFNEPVYRGAYMSAHVY